MPFIVITGGIGAGKSSVLDVFEKMGFLVLDADLIVHRIYETDATFAKQLVERWGERVLDDKGKTDRKRIADFVFSSPEELAWLNRLLHERVREEILNFGQLHQGEIIFIAIPLYYEVGWSFADAVISVWCSMDVQQQRLLQRGWSLQHIEERLKCQLSPDKKLEMADYGIINNGEKTLMIDQCELLAKELQIKFRNNQI